MADIEKTEFEFPDEVEQENPRKGGAVVEPEAAEPDIEVVDDTPEQDRNRRPMTTPPTEPSAEELEGYSESVKQRFKHFTKGYHEERRAKEAAQREKDEALRIAEQLVEENKKLKGSLSQGQNALLEQAKKTVAQEVEQAKAKYKAALEAFDTDATVAAQQALWAAQTKADRVNNFKPAPLQEEKSAVQLEQLKQSAPSVDSNLLAWQERNTWFGSNKRMTAYALGLHDELLAEGVSAGSQEYYKRIDEDLQQRFPDQFGAKESAEATTSQRPKSNVVAPATRSTAPKKIVLTQSQVNVAKRLGVPLELYARKVAEEMRK
jgi:hypothetical protein